MVAPRKFNMLGGLYVSTFWPARAKATHLKSAMHGSGMDNWPYRRHGEIL